MLKNLAILRWTVSLLLICLNLHVFTSSLSAEGTKQVSPLEEDIVILNIYQEGFANYGTHGSAKAMNFTIKDASETVYIGLSQLVNANGQFVTKDFSFRIVDPNGNIIHGPFQVNATNANGDLYSEVIQGPDLQGTGTGYEINDDRFVFSPNSAGDYTIEFEMEDGGTTAYGPKHWDISITDDQANIINGRLWSKCWGFRTPCSEESNCSGDPYAKPFNGSVFALTDDGYVHELEFQNSGFRGLSFVLAFNMTGPGNSGDPAFDRRSVDGIDADNKPATNPVYKVFLHDPDPFCYTEASIGQILSGPDFSFNVCTFSDGLFEFELSKAGLVELLIDLDGNDGVFTEETADTILVKRVLQTDPLNNSIEWDLVDGLGNKISENASFNIALTFFEGEIHFMQYDVEYNNPGFALHVLHPEENTYQDVFFYDDSNLDPSDRDANLDSDSDNSTGPTPLLVELNGCASPCHKWNYSGNNSNGYGERNTINTWWFGQVTAQASSVTLGSADPPTFDCPIDLAVECMSSIDTSITGSVTNIMDDCSTPGDIIVTFSDDNQLTGCNETGTIFRTFSVEDQDGNISTCIQTLTIVDTSPPNIFCPADIAIACSESIDTSNTGSPISNDGCGAVSVSFVDSVTGFDGTCTNQIIGVINREFFAEDDCGLISSCVQIITVVDIVPPIAVCNDITIDFMGEPVITIDPALLGVGSTDDCSSDLIFSLEQESFDCSDFILNPILIVDLSVLDSCNNETICSAQITFTGIPELEFNCPSDTLVQLVSGDCGFLYHYNVNALNPCGADPIIIQTDTTGFSSGDTFPIGITEQSYLTYNEYGDTLECTFYVEVLEFVQTNFAIVCNSNINISVDGACEVLITADMILEGDIYRCYDDYYIGVHTIDSIEIDNPIITYDPGYSSNTYIISIIDPLTGNSCWSTVVLEDKWDPSIDCACPPGAWISDPACVRTCFDVDGILNGQIGIPEASDNCEAAVPVFGGYDIVEGNNCGEFLISQFWSIAIVGYNGESFPEINCTNEFFISPLGLDAVSFPADAFVDCADAGDPSLTHPDNTGYPRLGGDDLGHYDENDNPYCMIFAAYTDLEIPACGADCNATKIIRTWTLLNWCTGEIDELVQFVVIMDAEAPTISIDDILVSTDVWQCQADVWLGEVVIHDNCDSNLDWELISTNAGAILVDEDGKVNSSKPKKHALQVPKGEWEFIVASTDCCNNTGLDTIQVTVKDLVAPVAVALQNIVLSLSNNTYDSLGLTKIYAESLDEGSHDNCTDLHFEIRREFDACSVEGNTTYSNILPALCNADYSPIDPDYGNYVKFCCADLTEYNADSTGLYGIVKVLLRVWDDANMDGVYGSYTYFDNPGTDHDYCNIDDNYNEAWSYVRVESNTIPDVSCPPDITIPCDWDYTDLSITGQAGGTGVCSNFIAQYTDWEEVHCGDGYILREWYIPGTDYSCTQTITITPIYDFNLVCPVDAETQTNHVIVDCADYEIPEPWYSTGACNLVGVSTDIDTFWFEPKACYKLIKQWHFVDWCTNEEYTCDFTVALVDTDAPELMCQDTCIAINDDWDADNDGNYCELTNDIILTQMASDDGDCGSEWIKWLIQIDYWNDGIIDTELSSFLSHSNPDYITPSLINEAFQIRMDKEDASAQWAIHSVKWKAFDGCGNVSQCTQFVEIADKKAPTPYCIGISTALMDISNSVEIWANDFNQGSTDNCTEEIDLYFTFNEIAPVLTKIDQEHCFDADGEVPCSQYENGYPIQKWNPVTNTSGTKFIGLDWCGVNILNVSIWDQKLNTDFCQVDLIIHGEACDTLSSGLMIAGEIKTIHGDNVANVDVHNENIDPNYSAQMTTGTDGYFAFPNNPMFEDFALSARKNDDVLNGVTTLDIVLIQRHILNINTFSNPYTLIAADVNNDEKISGIDIVELRKLVLGKIDTFLTNDSWRFVDKDAYMDSISPWPFTEVAQLEDLNQSQMNEDFIGVKIGDVNNSVEANLNSPNLESRNKDLVSISYTLLDGFIYEFRLLEDIEKVYGLQFALSSNSRIIALESPTLNLADNNFIINSDNSLLVSFSNPEGIKLKKGSILFSIKSDTDKNEFDFLAHSYKNEIYHDFPLSIASLELSKVLSGNKPFDLKLSPNPFTIETTLGFHLYDDEKIELEIFDIEGKLKHNEKIEAIKGWNNYTLSGNKLQKHGMYLIKLSTRHSSITKRLIYFQ